MSELSELRNDWSTVGKGWGLTTSVRNASRAISLSDPQLAINILQAISETPGSGVEIKYFLTLAHANSGSRKEVYLHLDELMSIVNKKDKEYVSALCLQGRLEKDRFIRLKGEEGAADALRRALKAYLEAYEFSQESFPGINAATLSYLEGDIETSQKIASEIIESKAQDQGELWQLATLAEAYLLKHEFDAAIDSYRQFIALCGRDYGTLNSTRKSCILLADKIDLPQELSELFDGPRICAFTGHMFDTDDRAQPRFPESLGASVAEEIGAVIDADSIKIGYCSAACGGDLLFAKEMIKRDLELNIVLPFDRDVFRTASVRRGGIDQSFEYWEVLEKASSVTIATEESYLGNSCLFSYAADLVEGYAQLRAKQLGGTVELLAAIDPYDAGLPGGSTELAQQWIDIGMDVHMIDIAELRGDSSQSNSLSPSEDSKGGQDVRKLDREIKTVVEIVTNHPENAEAIYKVLAAKIPDKWESMFGGGLNKAFNNVRDAADYAYLIRDEAQLVSWADHDLPLGTQVHIALHTGPVAPKTRSENYDYFGTHVFHARYLAELVPDGAIYLTEQAAALLVTHGPAEFNADFLGTMEVNLKQRQIYRLHRN